MRRMIWCATLNLFCLLSIVSLIGEIDTRAVKLMKETWIGHKDVVTLVYEDEHVAIYYDKEVNENGNITWPFEIISNAWKYVQETYGSMGPDPVLYVIFHATKHGEGCHTSWYRESKLQSQNLLDCGEDGMIQATPRGSQIFKNALYNVGEIILREKRMTLMQRDTMIGGEVILDILWYDLTFFLKDPLESLISRKKLKLKNSQNGIYWFRDWFLPIYEQFGGASVLRNFLDIKRRNTQANTFGRNLTLGEFVHFWSGAARQDLYPMAKLSINNSNELYTELVVARKSFPFIHYTQTSELKVIKETWSDHDEVVTLVYQDDHVAIYYDDEVNTIGNITWPFEIVSKAWKYVKQTYSIFSTNTLLYVIFHATKHDHCITDWYDESEPRSLNLLDCGEGEIMKATPKDSSSLFNILYYMGQIVAYLKTTALEDINTMIGGQAMLEILWYDLHLFLQDPTEDLNYHKVKFLEESQNGVFWFRDWFLPIYELFGGTLAVRNFFNITNLNFQYTQANNLKNLNLGEFVHIWSGAANHDLYPMAKLSVNNSKEFYDELLVARKSLPSINYTQTSELKVMKETWDNHDEVVTLAYQDDHVAIYYDKDVNTIGNITWPFAIVSKAWKYVKLTYGPFGPNTLLHVIFHAKKHNRCYTTWYDESKPRSLNLLDCGEGEIIKATPRDSSSLFYILYYMGEIVAYRKAMALESIKKMIGGRAMLEILWYDLTLFIGDPAENLVVYKKRFQGISQNGVFWFRDWFLPIYEQFGKTSVLERFVNITNYHLRKIQANAAHRNLNLGEVVHLWGGAAQEDLLPTAITSLNNSKEFYDELVKARKLFDFIDYTHANCDAKQGVIRCYESATCQSIALRCNGLKECSDGSDEANCTACKSSAFECASGGCVDEHKVCDYTRDCPFDDSDEINCTVVLNPKVLRRTWKQPSVDLEQVYLDDNVVVYFESGMNSSLLWATKIYSQAWAHVQQTYGAFTKNPRLSVVLRLDDKNQRDCKIYPPSVAIFAYQILIDCGTRGWALEKASNFQHFVGTIAECVRAEAKGTKIGNDIEAEVSGHLTKLIISYDLLVTLNHDSATEVTIWKEMEQERTWNGVYFFRDWFLPIYEIYGGSTALGNFYRVAKSNWGQGSEKTPRKYLNVGEFVHFWSGAAGADLLPIALEVFNDSSSFFPQLVEAKQHFPFINYTAALCRVKQFICKADHVCIREEWQCNGIRECSDESDEANCTGDRNDTKISLLETSHVMPIVVGVFLVASVGLGIKMVLYRTRIKKLQQIRGLTNAEVKEFLDGNLNSNTKNANNLIHSRPFISDYEIPREYLVIDESSVLGSGEFGIVKKGKLLKDERSSLTTEVPVAVKMVIPNARVEHFKAFLKEIKTMAFLGRHQNIVSLLGTVTCNIQNCEVFVALEFCSNGDLLHFLRENCDHFQDLFLPKVETLVTSVVFTKKKNIDSNSEVKFYTSKVSKTVDDASLCNNDLPFSTLNLLEWSRQIADGMNYLTFKKVLHGDLAARNVLLTENKTAKIGDFGLSHQLINYEIYRKTTESPLPWRWLAIESLSSRTFSVHSDVWAFGVTLWEIFTLGQVPYSERRWDNRYVNDLANGMRPNPPRFGNDEIYNLMMSCMTMVPAERIPFAEISLELQRIKTCIISENNLPSTSHGGSSCIYSVLQ